MKGLSFFAVTFAVIGLILFVDLEIKAALSGGHLPIFYDSAVYVEGAREFYRHLNLQTFLNQERPVFSWPLIVFCKLFHIDPSYNQFCLANELFSAALAGGAIFSITSISKAPRLVALWIWLLFCSLPTVFDLGSRLMGDVVVSAACLAISAALMNSRSTTVTRTKTWVLVGLIAVLGINTKPIFIPWALLLLVCSAGGFSPNAIKQKSSLASSILIIAALFIFWPARLSVLFRNLYFNDSTLDAFNRYPHPIDSFFWFPAELFRQLPLPCFGVLLTFTAFLALTLFQNRARLFEAAHPVRALWISWGLALIYATFFMKSKGVRTMLFLFPVFFTLVGVTAFRLGRGRRRTQLALTTGLLISILASIFTLSQWGGPIVGSGKITSANSSHVPFSTIESSGAFDLASLIEHDERSLPEVVPKALGKSVFFVQSLDWINAGVLKHFSQTLQRLSGEPSLPDHAFDLDAQEAAYRFGSWGKVGGIPAAFFTSRYIVHFPGSPPEVWMDNPASLEIAEKLSAQNSDFRSGLNLIGSVSTAYGRADVFRRQQLPSQSAFLNMVKDLIAVDEDNVWNYPFVLAASQTQAESFFSATENRLRTSLETQGAPAYLQPANDLVWLNAVKSKDRKRLARYTYPEFLDFTD